MNALRNNRHILDLIAKELLERSRVTGLVCYAPISVVIFVLPFSLEREVVKV